jgi:hypothetical protein
VIAYIGIRTDYAIMKQIQQLMLVFPERQLINLDSNTDFSVLKEDEPLYLIAHGDYPSGDFQAYKREELLSWLASQGKGVPGKFGGIVILSCYSGLARNVALPSLAEYIATGLKGKVADGITVAGANGYSFGTPEFAASGRCSVLSMDLESFNSLTDTKAMTAAWLAHKPTHTAGILKDLGVNVDLGKTIGGQLDSAVDPEKIVADFAAAAKELEDKLRDIATTKIPRRTASDAARYLLDTDQEPPVVEWNATVRKQYGLFGDHYLWAPPQNGAFTVVKVVS